MENTGTQKSKTKGVLKVLLKLVLTAVGGGAAFLILVLGDLLLRSYDIHMPVIALVTWIFPWLLLPVIWVKNRKKFMKLWLLAAVFCAIVLGADIAVVKHNESLKVETTLYHNIVNTLGDYNPFEEGSRVVKVDSQTLEFTDNLPVIDGTVAFHPLYCAFVHALYPESDELYYGSFDHVKSWGYEEMAEKKTDIFLTLEYPTEEHQAYAGGFGTEYAFTTVGTEAFVFIVDRDNPVDNLTTEQIRGIYSGEITNWKELGGKNKKIVAYQNAEDSSSQNRMESFMGDTPLMTAPTEKGYDELYAWTEDISPYRNRDNSIGYAFHYCVKDYENIKFLSVDGVAPTRENIENGTYRVVSPVLAVTYEGNPNENVPRMVDWMLTEEGQHIIRETGYYGLVSE